MEVFDEKTALKKLELHLTEKKRVATVYKWIKNEGVEVARSKLKTMIEKNKKKGTLEFYTEKYGEEEGNIKYKEKNSRLSVGYSSLKKSGKTEEEILKIKEIHRLKSARTLSNYIERDGEEEGRKKYEVVKSNFRNNASRCIEYYTSRGHSSDDAKILLGNVQRRDWNFFKNLGWSREEYEDYCKNKTRGLSLDFYIEKYGEEEGRKKFLYDSRKGSDLNHYIEKYGEKLGVEEFNKALRLKTANNKSSEPQLEFSRLLYSKLPSKYQEHYYGDPITPSFFIPYSDNDYGIRCSVPDIKIGNLVIEFDGHYWHGKDEVKFKDIIKDRLNEELGMKTLRVLELEFKKDPEASVNLALDFIHMNVDLTYQLNSEEEKQ